MTKHRALNVVLAIGGAVIFAAMLSTGHLLDMPSEAVARIDVARSAQDAERDAQHQARFEKAARRLCGENAGYLLLSDREIQCFTNHIFKTAKVAL